MPKRGDYINPSYIYTIGNSVLDLNPFQHIKWDILWGHYQNDGTIGILVDCQVFHTFTAKQIHIIVYSLDACLNTEVHEVLTAFIMM